MDGAEIPVAAKGWRKADHLGRGTLPFSSNGLQVSQKLS